MQPLLRITTIPIDIEFQVSRGALKQNLEQPRLNLSRSRGGLSVQSQAAKVHVDSYEARSSAGLKSAPRVIEEAAERGRANATEVARNYAEDGARIILSQGKGDQVIANAVAKLTPRYNTITAFIPETGPDITVESGSIVFNHEMDKLHFDWDVYNKLQLEFEPGGVDFTINQQPEVVIEYLGKPVYVPPSADPEYQPEPTLDAIA